MAESSFYKELVGDIEGTKFLPFEPYIGPDGGAEFIRRELGAPDDVSYGWFIVKTWQGDEGKWHIMFDFDIEFDTATEAMHALDEIIVKHGGMLISDKLLPFI